MKHRIATVTLIVSTFAFGCAPSLAFAQQTNKNRNTSVKGEMKQSGKEVKEAGKSLGSNVKRGRVARGGKHFGKGTGKAAKKTGSAVKNAAKP